MGFIKTLKSLTYNEPKSRAKYYSNQKFFLGLWLTHTFTKTVNQSLIRDVSSISLKRKQRVYENALRKNNSVKKLPNRLTLGRVDVII